MKLSNQYMKLVLQSLDEQFLVEAICSSTEEANKLCAIHRDWGVIAEDESGHIILANVHPRRSIRVTFENGDKITTWINGTVASINSYYSGKTFNVGFGPKDNMQKAIRVEFLDTKSV